MSQMPCRFSPNRKEIRQGILSKTKEELRALMQSVGLNPTEDELLDLINEVDYEGKGTIEFFEFLDLMAKGKKYGKKTGQCGSSGSGIGTPSSISTYSGSVCGSTCSSISRTRSISSDSFSSTGSLCRMKLFDADGLQTSECPHGSNEG